MVTIYKMSERIPVKIGPVEFKISPMTALQKNEITSAARMVSGEEQGNELMASFLAWKYSIKAVSGVNLSDGSDYKCDHDQDGNLTDDCTSELMQLECNNELLKVLVVFMTNIKDPKIKGVKVTLPNGDAKAKK